MSDQYRVLAKDPASGRVREHFAGNEEDARAYIANNFPRPHVEPGSVSDRLRADVQLVTPEGTRHEYHGSAGWVDIDDNDEIVGDNGDVEEVEEVPAEEVE